LTKSAFVKEKKQQNNLYNSLEALVRKVFGFTI